LGYPAIQKLQGLSRRVSIGLAEDINDSVIIVENNRVVSVDICSTRDKGWCKTEESLEFFTLSSDVDEVSSEGTYFLTGK
jgi:hypothetical protein